MRRLVVIVVHVVKQQLANGRTDVAAAPQYVAYGLQQLIGWAALREVTASAGLEDNQRVLALW